MKRKIVKLGPSTLVVSLPSKWIKKYNMKAGNEININEHRDGLILQTETEKTIDREKLDFRKHSELIKRIVAAKYMKGCDEIEILLDSREKSRDIQKRVDLLIGMEIIEQSRERLLLKNIGNDSEDTFEKVSRRILYLLQSISDESLAALQKKETDLAYLEDMEENVNKFSDYCFRLLNKQKFSSVLRSEVYYCILFLLEELGDEYKDLISYLSKDKLSLPSALLSLYEQINAYHQHITQLFLAYSDERAVALSKERDKLVTTIKKNLKKTESVHDTIILMHFERIIHVIIKIMNELMNLS